jgi:hypothetical protein
MICNAALPWKCDGLARVRKLRRLNDWLVCHMALLFLFLLALRISLGPHFPPHPSWVLFDI